MKKTLKNIAIFGAGSVVGFFLPEIVATVCQVLGLEVNGTPLYYDGCGCGQSGNSSAERPMKMGFCASEEILGRDTDHKVQK